MSEHQPSSGDFNRENQPATSDPYVCERCGAPLGRGYRFCSQACYHERMQEPKPKPMTREEMEAEMQAVFDRLPAYPEEGDS